MTVLMLVAAGGCMGKAAVGWTDPHSRTETLGQTPDEHHESVARIEEQNRKALAEDLDLLFMTDRPTRLTRWHGR